MVRAVETQWVVHVLHVCANCFRSSMYSQRDAGWWAFPNCSVACGEILFGACYRRIFNGRATESLVGRPLLDARWRLDPLS